MSDAGTGSGFNRLERYYHTLRHLKPEQVAARPYGRAKRGLLARIPGLVEKLYGHKPLPPVQARVRNPVRERWERKLRTAPRTFRFLNEELTLSDGWVPKEASHLWLFNLHYFDYLFEAGSVAEFQGLLDEWLLSVPPGHRVAWHPYPLSVRVANWIWNFSRLDGPWENSFRERFLRSLYTQLNFLIRNLEFDLLGNHLITNAKALCLGGVFFGEERFLTRGLEILQREAKEQILDDGGHFERSPMYHLLVLEDLFMVFLGMKESGLTPPRWLSDSLERMTAWSAQVFRDGTFPCLNDSSPEIAPPWNLLEEELRRGGFPTQVSQAATHHLKDSGLFIFQGSSLRVLFDAGPIGPDYLPGHAHNDTLSLLLWWRGVPVLTDAGVFEYREGPWRDYFRSARAHNVVVLDRLEPNDLWKSFRAGYRGHPYDARITQLGFRASDSAYERLNVSWHREIKILPDESGIEVIDSFHNRGPTRKAEIFFHFSPSLSFASAEELTLTGENLKVTVQIPDPHVTVHRERSYYSKEFGIKEERACLRLEQEIPPGESNIRIIARVTGL